MCPMPNGVNLVQVGQLKVFSLGENGSEAGSPPGMLKQRACKSSRTAMRACGRDSSLYGRYDARCATRRRISAAPGSNASCEIGEAASPGHGLAAWLQGTGSWHAGVWPGLAWPGLACGRSCSRCPPAFGLEARTASRCIHAGAAFCRLAASPLIRLSCWAAGHLAVQWVAMSLRDGELTGAGEAENQVPVGTRTVPL